MLSGSGSISATVTAVAPRGNAAGPNKSHAAGANSIGAAQVHSGASQRPGAPRAGRQYPASSNPR